MAYVLMIIIKDQVRILSQIKKQATLLQ